MIGELVVDDAARALELVSSVMIDPGLAQHLLAEAAGPLLAAEAVFRVGAGRIARVVERMGRCAQAEDRLARVDKIGDVLHLVVRQVAEPGGDDHHVRVRQMFQTGDVVLIVGIDRAVLGIDREQHRASETVPDSQDLAEHWHDLLRTVFFVSRNQHDMPAGPRPVAARVHHPGRVGGSHRGEPTR